MFEFLYVVRNGYDVSLVARLLITNWVHARLVIMAGMSVQSLQSRHTLHQQDVWGTLSRVCHIVPFARCIRTSRVLYGAPFSHLPSR